MQEMEVYVKQADFIFHLAGVNRPIATEDYATGNQGLTEAILALMKTYNPKVPLLLTSSIQAEFDNPYGQSKRAAELAVFSHESETGAPVYVFRLPNVFGKWSRPNYNTVIATFCHNMTHGIPLQVDQPDKELTLVYIDDVITAFFASFDQPTPGIAGTYCRVPIVYQKTLGELADKIFFYHRNRMDLHIDDFHDSFNRALYATYLSFLAEHDFAYTLDKKQDNRGWLAEFIKSPSMGQIFISRTLPGITRGNHWHHSKVEKFLVIEGTAAITFRKVGSEEIITYMVKGEDLKVLDIPAGYTHAITNTGTSDLLTLFWANEVFNPQRPDTMYLEV